jgi:hypothetical protein
VKEIKLRSGRQAMAERLQQLVAAPHLAAGSRPPDLKPPLPADRALAFVQLAAERINGALVRCEETFPQAGPPSVLLVVVDREAANWRETLNSLHSNLFGPGQADPLAPVQLEVIDRATDETIQRLIAAGVISQTARAARQLFPGQDPGGSAALSAEEKARAKVHRERATHKLKLARVLGEGGFGEEARLALLEAIHTLARALAVEQRLPEPSELKDALQPPLAHCWAETLPALKTFVQEPESDWKPAAECLARV